MRFEENQLRTFILFLMAYGLIVSPAVPASAYETIEVQNSGTISGVVKLNGAAPPASLLTVTRDQEVCGRDAKSSESLVVSAGGGIKYAVVSLQDIGKGKAHPEMKGNPRLVQEKCWFDPHVLLIPAGSTVDLFNHDKTMHNIHTVSKVNPVINKAHPSFRKRLRFKLKEPETIRVKCDMHTWMSAWFVVTDHPYYAVTDANGMFSLQGVPAGTYTLQVWHETLGQQTQKVTVSEQSEVMSNFSYTP